MGNTHDKPLPSLQERLPAHDQPGLARQSAGVASTSEQPNHRAKNGRQKAVTTIAIENWLQQYKGVAEIASHSQ
jgi:hypothetical protein